MPVEGAGPNSYHHKSFWFYPWGKSVTHKGVDIFARKGTPVHAATSGVVVFAGEISMGGNVVLVLGPKWRIHYYAHLEESRVSPGRFVDHQTLIGTVGNSGNAKGKPAHLHYSIVTLIPYPWRIDSSHQGWKKMFYLNPISYF
ncbi:MAG: M23 family metallopeptidase [Flavobacteriales bacterium]|nr:M23 family metallopeptidase [Flavobacteriales bacterium]